MKSALEGEYGLFFGQGAFLEAALTGGPGSSHLGPTSEVGSTGMSTALPPQGRHSALLERAGSGHPGRRTGGQACPNSPPAREPAFQVSEEPRVCGFHNKEGFVC